MKFEWFIGIDVSKKTLDFNAAHLSKSLFHRQVGNQKRAINSFLSVCKKSKIDLTRSLFILEHTGLYNEVLVDLLEKKGLTGLNRVFKLKDLWVC